MDDRLRPQSDRSPGAAESVSAAPVDPSDPSESSRPTAVVAVGISDSIADVLGRLPSYPGHEVRLTIPPGSALFLTASEFRALQEASAQANTVTIVETEDPLRRQLAQMFGLKTHQSGAPSGPRLVTQTPERPSSSAQSTPTPIKPGQIVPLPNSSASRRDQSSMARSNERTRLGRTPRSTVSSQNDSSATWARPVEVGPKARSLVTTPAPTTLPADHEDDDRTGGRRRTILIIVAAVIGLVLVILAGLAVAAMTLTTATVDLELRRQPVTGSTSVEFIVGGASTADSATAVPVQYVSVDVTVETTSPATGVDRVGVTPATGTIQLANPTDQAIEIAAGAAGIGDTGVEFIFTADTTVPPATDSAPGEAEVTIETTTLGTTANLEPGDLSGVLDSGVFFSNRLQELAGGTDEEGKVVSEDDIEAARSAAADALTEAASERFAQTLQANVMAVPSTFAIEEQGETIDHEAGDAAEAVTLRAVYSVTALTYAADDLENAVSPLLGDALAASIPDGYSLDESTIRLGVPEVPSADDSDGTISAQVPVNARASASFTPEQEASLIDRLEGADDDEAEAILAAEPAVESFTINQSPDWLARGMPADADRIEIHVDD